MSERAYRLALEEIARLEAERAALAQVLGCESDHVAMIDRATALAYERDELANRIKTLREVAQYGLRAARSRNYYKSLEWTNVIADSYKAIPDAPEQDRIQGHKVDTVILDEVAELRRLALAFVDARGRYHSQQAMCDLLEYFGKPCTRPEKSR